MERLGGVAEREDRSIWKYLRKHRKIRESQLPAILRNDVVRMSKKDATGQIKVRRMTGVVDNRGSRTLKQFERNVGGIDEIRDKLEAIKGELPDDVGKVLHLLKNGDRRVSLARVVAEAGASPLSLMQAYMRSALVLAQVEAVREAATHMPAVVKDLARHALDSTDMCETCVGSGRVSRGKGQTTESYICPSCKGDGKRMVSSSHKQFAISKLMEVTELGAKKEPGVQVNVGVGVKVGEGKGSFFERVIGATDRALFLPPPASVGGTTPTTSTSPSGEVVEAEVLST